jgi:hypothetical protein
VKDTQFDVFNCASACKSKVPKQLGISPYSETKALLLIALGLPDVSSTLGCSIIFSMSNKNNLKLPSAVLVNECVQVSKIRVT